MFTNECWQLLLRTPEIPSCSLNVGGLARPISELRHLLTWLQDRAVQEVVMESTAQYWRPVRLALEGHCRLHLAQARSSRGPRGRKTDFRDAQRAVSRLLSGDLILSYVPEPEQRCWRAWRRCWRSIILGERSAFIPIINSRCDSCGTRSTAPHYPAGEVSIESGICTNEQWISQRDAKSYSQELNRPGRNTWSAIE